MHGTGRRRGDKPVTWLHKGDLQTLEVPQFMAHHIQGTFSAPPQLQAQFLHPRRRHRAQTPPRQPKLSSPPWEAFCPAEGQCVTPACSPAPPAQLS